MKNLFENDLGLFEGFNFRNQSAVPKLLTAQEVLEWNHDKDGEAEFWAHGDNALSAKVFKAFGTREVTTDEIVLADKLLSLEEYELVQLLAVIDDQGLHYCRERLADNPLQLLEDYSLFFFSQEKQAFKSAKEEAAWDYLREYQPETYKILDEGHVPGVRFDPYEFFEDCSIRYFETEICETEYLVYWWM